MLLALDFIHTECKLVHTGTPYLKVKEKRFPLIILEISNRIISCRSLTTPLFSKSSFRTKWRNRHLVRSPVIGSFIFLVFWSPQNSLAELYSVFSDRLSREKRKETTTPSLKFTDRRRSCLWQIGVTLLIFGTWVLWRVVNGALYLAPFCSSLWKQIWFLLEGQLLFTGLHPTLDRYITRAHLAEIIGLLGPPPHDLIQKGARSSEFFDEDGEHFLSNLPKFGYWCFIGKWKVEDVEIQPKTLEESECCLEGEDKNTFLAFIRGMITWRQEDRKTAAALLQDPWLNS